MALVPVIDLFAGPGGLGEGFASLRVTTHRVPCFQIALSIEKDERAHRTLELRSFFRQFPPGELPEDYYRYLRGDTDRQSLFSAYPHEAEAAAKQAWRAELGTDEAPTAELNARVAAALGATPWWVLIGGPPCQAYSIIGRSRMRRGDPEAYDKDPRQQLYREYLRILAVHRPPIFVMENVPGLLSARVNGSSVFQQMILDLCDPRRVVKHEYQAAEFLGPDSTYRIHSFVKKGSSRGPLGLDPRDYIIRAEDYGIPQTRHRVILLGVRDDIEAQPGTLSRVKDGPTMWDAVCDIPAIRSRISREPDSAATWAEVVRSCADAQWLQDGGVEEPVRQKIREAAAAIKTDLGTGGAYVPGSGPPGFRRSWFRDARLPGYCNHEARRHMRSDLARYLFAACFAEVKGKTPKLGDYPSSLLPEHGNVDDALDGGYFNDRFRVQVKDAPSTTVVSHICKDGHYYVHPDPAQCRTLTVREAARLQTFPDNYFFEGPRTDQYRQVGNAVPPLLARQVAKVVHDLLLKRGAF